MALTRTAEEVEAIIQAQTDAWCAARDACMVYAKEATGWVPGDRVKNRYGDVFEVERFTGIHPNTWALKPCAVAKNVRKDGSVGVKEERIEIDTDGRWERKWTKVGGA